MICVIIPTLNAGDCLDGILSDLTQASVSIIVADGGSEDITVAQALQAGASLAVGAPGRGTQLARGADWAAQRAQVEWYLFLHADSRFDSDWALAVTLHINQHADKAGYFRFRAAAKGWKPRLMDFCVRWRELTFGGPYGDQGLLISRRLYEEIGGYDSVPLFEDVKIIDALKAKGALRRLPANLYTDVSAYEREGYWARTTRNLRLLKAYRRGEMIGALAEDYERPAV